MSSGKRSKTILLLFGLASLSGCASGLSWRKDAAGGTCQVCAGEEACATDGACASDPCDPGKGGKGWRKNKGGFGHRVGWACCGWMWKKSNAIPDVLPLGSTVRAHDQVMQTNAEAADFIFYQREFVGQTAELTPEGKDHILEVAARMRSTPFPVIIEREDNNSDPELDALRRNLVATILTDLGNADAQQRTVVATPYGPGYVGRRGEMMYYQHVYGNAGFGNNGFGGGGFNGGNGGFGGGGFF